MLIILIFYNNYVVASQPWPTGSLASVKSQARKIKCSGPTDQITGLDFTVVILIIKIAIRYSSQIIQPQQIQWRCENEKYIHG